MRRWARDLSQSHLVTLPARRPWHVAIAAFAAGLAASERAAVGPAWAILAAAVALALAAARPPGQAPPPPNPGRPATSVEPLRAGALAEPLRVLLLAGLLLVAGSGAGAARLAAIDAPAALLRDGAALDGRAVALAHPRPGPFGSAVQVEVSTGPLRGAHLMARVPRWGRWPPALAIGEEVRLRGRLRRLGGSDFERHLRVRGIDGELLVDSARATGRRRGGAAGLVDRLRVRAEAAVAAGLPRHEAALLRGMVLGQDEEIGEPTRDAFRASGLAHLLAVSGQNVMLLVALALPFLALAGLGIGGRAAVLMALIAIYVPLAGAGPSLQRAGVMGAAGVAAMAASRPASRVYALLLAAAATLALNPRAAADPGWQLSFAAVAGIIWLAPPLQRALRAALDALWPAPDPARIVPGRPRAAQHAAAARTAALRALADGAALTVAATVATAPLLGSHFGAVPLAGLPANLLALPAVAPAMWLGMVKAALGQLEAVVPGAGATAAALGPPTRLAVAWIDWLAERFAELPGGTVALPLGSGRSVAVAYVLIGLAAAAAGRAASLLGPRAHAVLAGWSRVSLGQRLALAALAAAALVLAAAPSLTPPAWPDRVTVRFLDVGQGDATLIQHPDGTAVLFDGGPPEAHVATLLRRLGVRRLALVVATHASRDHHGGLEEVIERLPVDVLLDGGDGTADPAYRAMLATARREGVRRVAATAPLGLRAGGLAIRVLSPPPRAPGPPADDPNPRAVVAIVSAGGFDLFLSADAESDALAPLALPDVDAMKVAHHGSDDDGLPELLSRLRPEAAAIEVGAENTYGHPAPSTLRALRVAGVRTWRTDRHGTVTLTATAGGMAVATAP